MAPAVPSVMDMSHLISAADLAARLGSDEPPVVLDIRWSLDGPPGHGVYLDGHIPGAVYVDLDTELAGRGQPTDGRHPLPTPDAFQAAVRRWGIDEDDTVVVYDGGGNLAAARAWWLLRWAGLTDVRLLDGALPAWTAQGGSLATEDVTPVPGDATVRPGAVGTLDLGAVGAWPREGVLLDARAVERYRGEVEPVDPRAGQGSARAPSAHRPPRTSPTMDGSSRLRNSARDSPRSESTATVRWPSTAAPASPRRTRSPPWRSRVTTPPSSRAPGPNGATTISPLRRGATTRE